MIQRALAIVLFATASAYSAMPDGGGRDVQVALFSTRVLRSVTLTPLGADTWTARCISCVHVPLVAPMHVVAPELFSGGWVKLTDDTTGDTRVAAGLWHLRHSKGEIDVVLTMPSERYVEAVLSAEAASDEPIESLRALAIVARTFALNGRHYSAAAGHLQADLCDSTECEAMRLGPVSSAIDEATRTTAGETLWFGRERAEVFFSQSCGGLTEDAGAVWPRLAGTPYLHSHPDLYCLRRDKAAWHAEVPAAQLAAIARNEGWRLPAEIASVRIIARSISHRALRVAFTGTDGTTAEIAAGSLRLGIGRALGWDRLRSDAYDIALRNGIVVFDGHGHGHGVGLCQAGAAQMAVEGKSVRDILAFYFPGTAMRITVNDSGWQTSRVDSFDVESTQAFSATDKDAIHHAWEEARLRYPSHATVRPRISFAPTTELFRQMTAQPGWALASTQGDQIVLQSEAVLRSNGVALTTLLLHEMLHVVVEADCTIRTPLWLREGLVEVLASDAIEPFKPISLSGIDDALRHGSSLHAAQSAHRAAAGRVKALIQRYGVSTVRGWLRSGIPPGVE